MYSKAGRHVADALISGNPCTAREGRYWLLTWQDVPLFVWLEFKGSFRVDILIRFYRSDHYTISHCEMSRYFLFWKCSPKCEFNCLWECETLSIVEQIIIAGWIFVTWGC